MSRHTRGPLNVDDIYEEGGRDLILGYEIEGAGSPISVAHVNEPCEFGFVPKDKAEVSGNARLLAAAFNSYDKHCGDRAIECAEGDLLGELIEACRSVGIVNGAVSADIAAIEGVLAKIDQS